MASRGPCIVVETFGIQLVNSGVRVRAEGVARTVLELELQGSDGRVRVSKNIMGDLGAKA